jgi:putative addiction module component (TIGR02574 family)
LPSAIVFATTHAGPYNDKRGISPLILPCAASVHSARNVMSTLQDILAAAQQLPSTERVQLIHALWDVTPPEAWPQPSDAWLAEANRRSDAIDAGEIAVASWDEVRARTRRQAGLDG